MLDTIVGRKLDNICRPEIAVRFDNGRPNRTVSSSQQPCFSGFSATASKGDKDRDVFLLFPSPSVGY